MKLEEQDQQFCQNSDNSILCITTLIYAKARLNDDLDRFKNRIRSASPISDSQIPNIVTSCQKGLQKLAQTTFTPQFSQNYQNYRYFQGTALALLGQFSHQGSNGMIEQKRYICFYINGPQGLTIPIIEE
ncbi:MAG: hypothetical protein HC908_12490 [Calothrix sp. SM1_7_51]|nr:hypothetical protein [Calothrix sp. SM1_7_51]